MSGAGADEPPRPVSRLRFETTCAREFCLWDSIVWNIHSETKVATSRHRVDGKQVLPFWRMSEQRTDGTTTPVGTNMFDAILYSVIFGLVTQGWTGE